MGLDEHLSEEEHVIGVRLLEFNYEQSEAWQNLVSKYGSFAALHHPWADLVNDMQGYYILMSLSRPKKMSGEQLGDYDRFTDLIMAEGGSINFDRASERDWLQLVTRHSPASFVARVKDVALEKYVTQYLQHSVMPALAKALQLPDNEETENAVGYTREQLYDLAACVQSFLFAKTKGLEAVRPHIAALQKGELVYS